MHQKNAHRQTQRFLIPFIPLFVLALVLLAWPTHTAHAATLTVDTGGTDSGDCIGSPCASITYAIGQATAGDTINVAAGTYTEAGITVDKNLTITGAGADVTIVQAAATAGTDGTGDSVFRINSGITAVLENMTIRHGNTSGDGGGIYNFGTLTVNNTTLTGNSAGHGGGILSGGTLTVNNATISGNSAGYGSGIRNDGTLTVNNATISGNSADYGGGILSGGTLTVNNATISGNSADYGGGIDNDGTLTVSNTTIADNSAYYGGGINNNGPAYISHTIIISNTAGFSGPDCDGTLDSQGYNLIGNTADCTINGDTTGNITGQSADLGPLQDNGGPTLTHRPNSTSPVIDAGDTTCGTMVDQRGAARAYGGNCDIGAVEVRETMTAGTCGSGTPLSGSQPFAFGSGTVTVNVNTAAGLDCIQIEEMGGNHLLATTGIETGNWWHITGNITDSFNVDITLPYAGADADSRVCKSPGNLGGAGWNCGPLDGTGTSHVANTSVTRLAQTSFSDWAVGQQVGPTAVTGLHSTADNAGASSRLPLVLVVIMGAGTAVLVAARRRSL